MVLRVDTPLWTQHAQYLFPHSADIHEHEDQVLEFVVVTGKNDVSHSGEKPVYMCACTHVSAYVHTCVSMCVCLAVR